MRTLYGSMMSRAHRVVWMLKELDLAFEHVQTSFLDGSTRTPDFLALNPNGRVPVLDDDGFLMFESLAINLYLAKKHPGPLTPVDLREEALAIQWSFWVATEIEKPLLLASANRALFAADSRNEEEAAMAIAKLARPLQVLDNRLRDQPFLLHDRFTVADLNVATVLDLAPQCGISLDDFPHAAAWHRRCLDRPAAADWKTVAFSIPRPPTALGVLRMFI